MSETKRCRNCLKIYELNAEYYIRDFCSWMCLMHWKNRNYAIIGHNHSIVDVDGVCAQMEDRAWDQWMERMEK